MYNIVDVILWKLVTRISFYAEGCYQVLEDVWQSRDAQTYCCLPVVG